MTAARPFSRDRREFAEEPARADLDELLGEEIMTDTVDVRETADEIRVRLAWIPLRAVAIFVVAFAAALGIAAVLLGRAGHAREATLLGWFAAAVLVLVGPGFLGILWVIQQAIREHGDGAVVDRRARTLALPRAGLVAAAGEIVFFSELHTRHRWTGHDTNVVQTGVVLRDADGGFVQVPIETQSATPLGTSAGQRLAEFFDVPLRRVRADGR